MSKKSGGNALQLPLFSPPSDWTPPVMGELPSWKGAKRVSIDVETRDELLTTLGIGVRRGGYVTGISFALEGQGRGYYLPIRHLGGDNLPEASVWAYLRAQAKDFDGEVVGARLDYDLDYLWENGVEFPNVRFYRDVQIADPLIWELHLTYSLKNIGKRWGIESKDEDALRQAALDYGCDPKKEMWKLPGRFVGTYAERDVTSPLEILAAQEAKLFEKDIKGETLQPIWDIESQVLPILVKMRRRGVLVDWDKLARIEKWSEDRERWLLEIVRRETGVNISVGDVWKPEVLAPAILQTGFELQQTAQGQPNIDKDVLAAVGGKVGWALGLARKVNKLRTTFAGSVRTHAVGDRIHCTFNQIARETEGGDQKGARYGRLSCELPNLQQQPSRDYFAKMWRSIYIPEVGGLWACNDYSQQEPRWTTHFAAEMDLPGARAAAQAYWDNPKLDNHDFMAKLTGLPRKAAKNIYLGLCYGEGGAKLCRDVGQPTRWCVSWKDAGGFHREFFEDAADARMKRGMVGDGIVFETAGEEGQRIIDTFDERAPFIRLLSKRAEKAAKSRGFVKTVMGRVLHFEEDGRGGYDYTHKALNRVIQGSSADQMKAAMIEIDRAGYFLQLQVHDETDSSVGSVKEGKEIGNIMRETVTARVPFRVDTEIGPNWGYIKEA